MEDKVNHSPGTEGAMAGYVQERGPGSQALPRAGDSLEPWRAKTPVLRDPDSEDPKAMSLGMAQPFAMGTGTV